GLVEDLPAKAAGQGGGQPPLRQAMPVLGAGGPLGPGGPLGAGQVVPLPGGGGVKVVPMPGAGVPGQPGQVRIGPGGFSLSLGEPGATSPLTLPNQVVLKDGQAQRASTDNHSAVRVRALDKADKGRAAAEGEILLNLEVAPELKLNLQRATSVHVSKAM